MKIPLIWFFFLFIDTIYCIQCSLDGKTVPWFVALKPPAMTHSDAEINAGTALFVYSPFNPSFTRMVGGMTGPSDLTRLLAPLATPDPTASVVLWSDQPPDSYKTPPSTRAHDKGFAVSNGDGSGFVLVHSLPKFPSMGVYTPFDTIKYGQSFICINFDSQIDETLSHLLFTERAAIYDSTGSFNDLQKTKEVIDKSTYDKTQQFTVHTHPTATFYHVTSTWGTPLLEAQSKLLFWEQLANEIDPEGFMIVESWTNGVGTKMDSFCPPESSDPRAHEHSTPVTNAVSILLGDLTWKRTQDHSKWGISGNHACFGGVNRMLSQGKRGGGAICLDNHGLAQALRELVQEVEYSCPGYPHAKHDVQNSDWITAISVTISVVVLLMFAAFGAVKGWFVKSKGWAVEKWNTMTHRQSGYDNI